MFVEYLALVQVTQYFCQSLCELSVVCHGFLLRQLLVNGQKYMNNNCQVLSVWFFARGIAKGKKQNSRAAKSSLSAWHWRIKPSALAQHLRFVICKLFQWHDFAVVFQIIPCRAHLCFSRQRCGAVVFGTNHHQQTAIGFCQQLPFFFFGIRASGMMGKVA